MSFIYDLLLKIPAEINYVIFEKVTAIFSKITLFNIKNTAVTW